MRVRYQTRAALPQKWGIYGDPPLGFADGRCRAPTKMVSELTRSVSGLTKMVSELTRGVSGLTKMVSELTRGVSGLTKMVSELTHGVSGLTKMVSERDQMVSLGLQWKF